MRATGRVGRRSSAVPAPVSQKAYSGDITKEVEDPFLDRAPVGPDQEPGQAELLKEPEARRSSVASAPSGRLARALHVLGPGLITGASDDDPSGIGTYSQVGSQFGYGLLWTALFTFPLMAAVQELCARIALHTGVGLGVA